MNYEVYHIPTNFTDAGRVMGLFELRNLVEAVIMTVPALYLCIAFLPFSLTTKVIVTLVIVVPLGGFGLIGHRAGFKPYGGKAVDAVTVAHHCDFIHSTLSAFPGSFARPARCAWPKGSDEPI